MGYRVVVVGATGNVGREMMNVLAERAFPCDEVAAVASSRSQGTTVEFGDSGKMLKCQNIENFDFTGWDIALFSAGSGVARDYGPKAAAQGCVVIDNSSYWRMDPDVPLIVPEVNPEAIDGYKKKLIIANPNCSTAQMVVALKPLHDAATITRVVVATYQSTSGAGKVKPSTSKPCTTFSAGTIRIPSGNISTSNVPIATRIPSAGGSPCPARGH